MVILLRFSLRPINVTFQSIHDPWSLRDANYTKTIHYTPFHGLCTSFFFPEEQPIKNTAEFISDSKTSLALYLLTHPGEILLFFFYANYPTTSLVELNTQSLVEVNYKSFEMLNTEYNPCWENAQQTAATDCLINLLEKQIATKNYTCVPPALERICPLLRAKYAKTEKLMREFWPLSTI